MLPAVTNLKQVVATSSNTSIACDNMCSAWGSTPVPQLSVVLVWLKYLQALHQNHHWTAKGDPFYGDHLLFARLYDAVTIEIDAIAEKAIGLGSTASVDMSLVHAQVCELISSYSASSSTIQQSNELARKSLSAETEFLKVCAQLAESMKQSNVLTRGLDNLLAGIEDKHESHVYLLKQRCSKGI